jgi:hypothetical protein
MVLWRLTPWAAQQITPELREAIEAAEPRDLLVTLGRGSSGWTCRLLSPRQEGVVGEAYGAASMKTAYEGALSDALSKSDRELLTALG